MSGREEFLQERLVGRGGGTRRKHACGRQGYSFTW